MDGDLHACACVYVIGVRHDGDVVVYGLRVLGFIHTSTHTYDIFVIFENCLYNDPLKLTGRKPPKKKKINKIK